MAGKRSITDLSEGQSVQRQKIEAMTTEGKPRVVAKYVLGFTVNLGNYESCKFEVGVELEGTSDHLDELQQMAVEVVEEKVGQQLEELKTKPTNETLLGRRA